MRRPMARGPSKYGNKKTTIIFKGEEVTFDSRKEAARAKELELLERAGEIEGLEIQKAFILQEGFVNSQGKKRTPIKYIADFVYWKVDGKDYIYTIEDVKSPATKSNKVYQMKKKMMEYQGYEIQEV